ncbi:MAG: FAD-dependent oxidoreductase [Candidatus Desulforudis sp.]|nr:FAD-dependent oxidoreductase [Desulforudis sp.]
MSRKPRLILVTALLAVVLGWGALQVESPLGRIWPRTGQTVVIYGGGFAGSAAAFQTAAHLPPGNEVLLIVPESVLGGIGTAGGQNFFDIRNWQGEPPTRGRFARWFDAYGQGYPTQAMAELLSKEVMEGFPDRVRVLFQHEIEEVHVDQGRRHITGLTVRPVTRNPGTQTVEWAGTPRRIEGDLFIDASDTGRLTRLAGVPLSPGRLDWAADGQQQAATLMFQVTGIDPQAAKAHRHPETGKPEFFYFQDADGSRLGWGGKAFTRYDPVITAYNNASHRFTLKGYNIAEDTPDKWWLNVLLIHEVNGMQQEIDRNTHRWPAAALTEAGQWSTDQAYREALTELERPRFLAALRRFPGFEAAELVRRPDGSPVVGAVLYLRETAHATRADGAFALPTSAVRHTGDGPNNGADQYLHPARVGLGLYYIDINAYRKGEPLQTLETPPNPHYIPYTALITPAVDNLLLPGYTQSTSSEAWASMRVIPNLTVTGDAAGLIAAYCLENKKSPAALDEEDLLKIQELLKQAGARLDKTPEFQNQNVPVPDLARSEPLNKR